VSGAIDLRVMSYNVHMQRDDPAALAAVVRGAEPDVLIVQEAPRRFRWRAKCAQLAHSLGLVVLEGGLPSLGNLLLSSLRVQAHETWSMRLPLTPGRHMRGAAFAVCSIGRTRFAVAGSHLSTDPKERPNQATLVRKAVAEIDVPVVLGVDLNDTPDGPAWRTLADGLVDVAAQCSLDDRVTFSCTDPRRRIDAVFTDPRFTVKRYDVIDTPEARRASDHFPIVVDLALPGS
jgi:endonuclease/exonuclease/phosphatase family metal-dependent hydrolase